MIVIKDLENNIVSKFEYVLGLIRSGKIDSLDLGHYEFDYGVSANLFEYQTKSGLTNYEAHRKYIDVHYAISGEEIIKVANVDSLKITKEYTEEGDYLLGESEGKEVVLKEKEICILFPEEAHLTGNIYNNPTMVRKIVFKVPV